LERKLYKRGVVKVCSNVYSKKHVCHKTGHAPIPQPLDQFKNDTKTCLSCRLVTREAGRKSRKWKGRRRKSVIVRHVPIVQGDEPKFVDEGHRKGFEMWLGDIVKEVKESTNK
jgi:hypothetical protein